MSKKNKQVKQFRMERSEPKEDLTLEMIEEAYDKEVNPKEEITQLLGEIDIVEDDSEAQLQDFTPQQLHDALLHIVDIMERAHINFVLLGDTAYQIKTYPSMIGEVDYIHVGILGTEATRYGIETIKSFWKDADISDDQISYNYNGVPIQVDILDKDDRFAKNPDSIFYFVENLKLPNPFEEYWEKYND